jgi:hypothetical protein
MTTDAVGSAVDSIDADRADDATTVIDQREPPKRRSFLWRIGWFFSREGTLVVIAGFIISAGFNWQLLLHPKSADITGVGDPLEDMWQLSWLHHWVLTGGDLWTANYYVPSTNNFAFTDSLLGYLPLSMLFGDGQYDAVLRYNVVYVFAFAVAFVGAYLLTRQLGGRWPAALVAAAAFAYAPTRWTQDAHLNILSIGGIALALFALARGHGFSLRGGMRPERAKPWWALAGWLIALWQVSISFSIGIPFVYILGVVGIVVVIVNLRRRHQLGWHLPVANAVGIVVFLAGTYLLTRPYLKIISLYGFKRGWTEVQTFSAPPQALLTAPDQAWLWRGSYLSMWNNKVFDNSWVLGHGVGEELLFPGLFVTLFAIVGLCYSAWSRKVRIWLFLGTALATVLALGATVGDTHSPFYYLWAYLPGWNSIRTPGRLIIWALLGLALLAAGMVTKLVETWSARRKASGGAVRLRTRLAGLALVVPALAVLLEGSPGQLAGTPPGIPPDLRQLFETNHQPMLILPISDTDNVEDLLWSTYGFPQLANGYASNGTPAYQDMAFSTQTFPDVHSVKVMLRYHVYQVVILRVAAHGTEYEQALNKPLTGLPVTKVVTDDYVLFTVHGPF